MRDTCQFDHSVFKCSSSSISKPCGFTRTPTALLLTLRAHPSILLLFAMEEEPMIRRVRVVFDDHRHLLTKPQRLDGLKKCWLLLRPKLATISDLSSHLSRRFHLRRSCPLGLVLSVSHTSLHCRNAGVIGFLFAAGSLISGL